MAVNPVETMNVFSPELSNKLRERSKSSNLLQTRTPFLRFTTAAIMSDIGQRMQDLGSTNADKFSNDATGYNGYKFFTLGVHGYRNQYSVSDLYGTQATTGLVIGTTYKEGEQRLVKTYGGQLGGEAAKNYPPPGVTSARVERLRNGNVLKFTVEVQCYTQEQLEMLDIVCFIPGMTCILEWGTIENTPNGFNTLRTLDFTQVTAAEGNIQYALTAPRVDFMKQWCQPNNFNYDWTVANIANIQTTLVDNIYRTTITAYSRADNLLYLSAYATSNPLEKETTISTSLTNYFKLNGDFSNLLKIDYGSAEHADKLIKFVDSYDRAQLLEALPGAQSTGQANDFGLEDTFFMTVEYFINRVMNDQVRNIVLSGLSYNLKEILSSNPTGSYVGWNPVLRSTAPELMIIYNERAISENKAPKERTAAVIAQLPGTPQGAQGLFDFGADSRTNASQLGNLELSGRTEPTLEILKKNAFVELPSPNAGSATLLKGVWLNSKAIQAAFINARTIMEGIETLLRNMNAATEGYWDLKLYYDDDIPAFRILDDNLRIPVANAPIYEFNKRLTNTADIIGPEVLSVEIKTDYPKLLFSQLAVAGINGGLSSLPTDASRNAVNFIRETSVRDIFAKAQNQLEPVKAVSETPKPAPGTPWVSVFNNLENKPLFDTLGSPNRTLGFSSAFSGTDLYNVGVFFPNGVPQTVVAIIDEVFSNTNMLSTAQASSIRERLSKEQLTQDQSAIITQLFGYRSIAIIRRDKQQEIDRFNQAFDYAKDNKGPDGKPLIFPDIWTRDVGPAKNAVIKKIEESRDILIQEIQSQLGRVITTQPGQTAINEAANDITQSIASR